MDFSSLSHHIVGNTDLEFNHFVWNIFEEINVCFTFSFIFRLSAYLLHVFLVQEYSEYIGYCRLSNWKYTWFLRIYMFYMQYVPLISFIFHEISMQRVLLRVISNDIKKKLRDINIRN